MGLSCMLFEVSNPPPDLVYPLTQTIPALPKFASLPTLTSSHCCSAIITHSVHCSSRPANSNPYHPGRYHLTYHTPHQIIWGAMIGVCTGTSHYLLTELYPTRYPTSLIAKLRSAILDSPIARWVRIRDGWALWNDGGKEHEYERWRNAWDMKSKEAQQGGTGSRGRVSKGIGRKEL